MKLTPAWLITPALLLLVSCQSPFDNAPPAVTRQFATDRGTVITLDELARGRRLFASHCIECHVLPPIAKYRADRWPRIVGWMAPRAGLKPDQREAVIAYILAAHRQETASDTRVVRQRD